MKSFVEFVNEAKNSPAKEFFKLWKNLTKFGIATSGANAAKVNDEFKSTFDSILNFLKDYEVTSIKGNESSLTNLYFFLDKHGRGTNLYIAIFNKDLESFECADLFIGNTTWVSSDYLRSNEVMKLEKYMIPNAFANHEDARYFVDYLGRNLTGDIEDENLLK